MTYFADKILKTQKYKDTLTNGDLLLVQYKSTDYERSLAKNIPMKFLSLFYDYSKIVTPLRIRYRGKSKLFPNGLSYKRPSSFIKKAYADSFAVYKRN